MEMWPAESELARGVAMLGAACYKYQQFYVPWLPLLLLPPLHFFGVAFISLERTLEPRGLQATSRSATESLRRRLYC